MSPIGRYLVEFDAGQRGGQAAPFGLPSFEPDRDGAMEPHWEARIEEARDEGFRAGEAAARAAAETAVDTALAAQAAALDTAHAEQRAADRAAWVDTEASTLADALRRSLQELEDRLADGLAEVLQPLLGAALRGKAVADLTVALKALLAADPDRVLEVSGPADLVAALAEAFADVATVRCRAAETVEVNVLAGPTAIRTRLGAWAASLDQHLGEPA